MPREGLIKVEELKETVRQMVREELGRSVQDVEEIRRSPAGAVIRMEEEIKAIRREMVTKEELYKLERRVESLSGRMEGLSGKINLIIGLIFAMLALYGGLIAKLVFLPK